MIKLYTKGRIDKIKEEAGKAAVEAYKRSVAYPDIDQLRNDCSVMLRLNNPYINIFSIERVAMNEPNERTIVGYVFTGDEKPVVKEWSLIISRRQHNELITKYTRDSDSVVKEAPKKEPL